MNSSRVRVEWPMVNTIGEGSGGGIRLRTSPATFACLSAAVIFRDLVMSPDAPLLRTDGSLAGGVGAVGRRGDFFVQRPRQKRCLTSVQFRPHLLGRSFAVSDILGALVSLLVEAFIG